MKPPEGFSDMGIALTDEAKAASRQSAARAVVEFGRRIAALRRQFPGLKIAEIGGSHANPRKSPRFGIFPAEINFQNALWEELLKQLHHFQSPSDVDIIMNYPPCDGKGRLTIYSRLKETARDIFEQTGIVIHPVEQNPGDFPTITVRKLLDRLNGK